MGGRKKKAQVDPNNLRLDLFLKELQIKQDTRKKMIDHVEDVTFNLLKEKGGPQLRLKKP